MSEKKKKVVAFTAGRRNGTTETLTKIALEAIEGMGIDVELIRLNECDLHPCSACGNGPCADRSREGRKAKGGKSQKSYQSGEGRNARRA